MIAKILKKLGLGHSAYRLAAPFYSAKYKGAAGGKPEEAMALLRETSPDIGSSCHIPRRQSPAGPAAELDIIVPAYNVEKYISQCVTSVLEQETKHSFRLIVIDDGSTDATGSILDSFQGLTVIHQENRGFSGARNRGLELANADYLMFLDSDDCLCPGAIESLMDAATENNAWIVEGNYTEVDTEGQVIRRHSHRAGALDPVRDCEGYVWGKVIRRELFCELAFPKITGIRTALCGRLFCRWSKTRIKQSGAWRTVSFFIARTRAGLQKRAEAAVRAWTPCISPCTCSGIGSASACR